MIDDGLIRASYRAVATTTGRPAPRLRAGRLDGADRALTAWSRCSDDGCTQQHSNGGNGRTCGVLVGWTGLIYSGLKALSRI